MVVLEANDYLGGRMCTQDGLDLGAHWIHGFSVIVPLSYFFPFFLHDSNIEASHPNLCFSGGDGADLPLPLQPAQVNPVRTLCDSLGLQTTFVDGNSTYPGAGRTREMEIIDAAK